MPRKEIYRKNPEKYRQKYREYYYSNPKRIREMARKNKIKYLKKPEVQEKIKIYKN